MYVPNDDALVHIGSAELMFIIACEQRNEEIQAKKRQTAIDKQKR